MSQGVVDKAKNFKSLSVLTLPDDTVCRKQLLTWRDEEHRRLFPEKYDKKGRRIAE